MPIKMHQVHYFLAICEERNFTRAAQRCGVAQPSLTRAIRQLESDLGGPLFDRGGASSQLTALGAFVRPEFERIGRSVQNALDIAARRQRPKIAPLHLLQQKRFIGAMAAVVLIIAILATGLALHASSPATASAPGPGKAQIDADRMQSGIELRKLPPQNGQSFF